MRSHLERAVQLAAEQGRPAARCEALALLAVEASRPGAARSDPSLLGLAESAATEAKELAELLPGHPPWGPQAEAALARVALARGDVDRAAAAGRAALRGLTESYQEDAHFQVLIPAAEALLAGGSEEERQTVRLMLQVTLAQVVQRTLAEDLRVRWLRGPIGRELVALGGPIDPQDVRPTEERHALQRNDTELLQLLVEGLTNREIAGRLDVEEEVVARRLTEMLGRIGASSRAGATAFAFREQLV
jgi:DNA-binding NarL/FixJ family response regulator